MVEFSLLCPTRERKNERNRFLISLVNTINNFDNVEILFAVDKDDIETQKDIEHSISTFSQLKIKMFVRNRSIFLNRDYYNWLTGFANGNYYWITGDDLIFMSKDWDYYLLQRIKEYTITRQDRIFCIGPKDNTPRPSDKLPHFPCFPILTKEAVYALGFALHPNAPTWGADFITFKIFSDNHLNRMLIIDDRVFINHVSWHTRQVSEDPVNKRIGGIFNKLKMIPLFNTDRILAEEVNKYALYLQNWIEKQIVL